MPPLGIDDWSGQVTVCTGRLRNFSGKYPRLTYVSIGGSVDYVDINRHERAAAMTDTYNQSAKNWILRLEAELAELQARPDYRQHAHTAEGIRSEIDRVNRELVSRSQLGTSEACA